MPSTAPASDSLDQSAAEANAIHLCLSQSPVTMSAVDTGLTRFVRQPHPRECSLEESSGRDLRAPTEHGLPLTSASAHRASAEICRGSTNRCRAGRTIQGGSGTRQASDVHNPPCWLPTETPAETFDFRPRIPAPLC